MANHASAEKRIRRNARRAEINGARRNRIRTFIKKVESAIANGNAEEAQTALQSAQPEMQRGVAKGIFHQKTISRKISRLSNRIKTLKNK
ncbi:MAG: 30S ribosomal protein S20 [Bdellovibrionales bacterium]